MGDWALAGGAGTETAGVTAATSIGIAVTASASANTKGSWVELTSATAREAVGLLVNIGRGHTAGADFLVDIGIGAAASETVLIPNLKGDNGSNLLGPGTIYIPIGVPAGTRLSARCQCTSASGISRVQVVAVYGGWVGQPPLAVVTDHGSAVADSGGVSVDPGGTANTKGSYSQIVASTSRAMKAMIIGIGNQNNGSRTIADFLLDLAIGAAASETIIVADLHLEASASDDAMRPVFVGPIPISIPAGTRLAARAACTIIDATDRLFDVIIYGVD